MTENRIFSTPIALIRKATQNQGQVGKSWDLDLNIDPEVEEAGQIAQSLEWMVELRIQSNEVVAEKPMHLPKSKPKVDVAMSRVRSKISKLQSYVKLDQMPKSLTTEACQRLDLRQASTI